MKLKITISFLIAIFIYGCDSSNRIWKIFEEEDLLKTSKSFKMCRLSSGYIPTMAKF